MTPKPISLSLARGEQFAEKIIASLSPYCERIEIAGSIRRRRPMVGDIDIVCLPKDDEQRAILRLRALSRSPFVMQDGPNQLLSVFETNAGPVQVDLWFATQPTTDLFNVTPGNWGSLFMCRTGSEAHNIWLASCAKKQGKHWNPYKGLYAGNGRHLGGETEESIYAGLDIAFIQPPTRER